MNQNCSMCNIKIEEINDLKARTVRKRCYKKNRRKNKNYTLIQSQQSKSDNNYDNNKKIRRVVDSMNNNNNRTLIIGFSNCGKTYVMNHILLTKQEPIFYKHQIINSIPSNQLSNIRRNSTLRKL